MKAPSVAAMQRAGVTVTGVLPDFGEGLLSGLRCEALQKTVPQCARLLRQRMLRP